LADSLYGRADSLLQLAGEMDEHWAEPNLLRGQVAYERAAIQPNAIARGRLLDSAVVYGSQALATEPGYAAALSLRGRARRTQYVINASADPQRRAALLDSAKSDLEAATNADATQAEAFFALSQVYYDLKDNVSALLAARRAYESDAFLRNQHINLRQLFWTNYDLEQLPAARQWCDEGARRFPNLHIFAECQLWLMLARGSQPDIDRAWELAAEAEQLAPADRKEYERNLTRIIVAGALARAEKRDSALKVLATAVPGRDIDPRQELMGYSAIVHIILGDHAKAIELLKQYVVLNPTHEFMVGRDLHWWWRPLEYERGFQAIARRQ
jgi:hypothetical protein